MHCSVYNILASLYEFHACINMTKQDQKYCRCLIEGAKCRPKWIMNIVMHERLHVHWQLYLLNYNEEL